MTGRTVAGTARCAMVALVVVAIGTQLTQTVRAGNSVVNFFSFFTIQSNVIGAVAV